MINFNCGLRTHSLSMKVQDYIEVEKPIIIDFVREAKPVKKVEEEKVEETKEETK